MKMDIGVKCHHCSRIFRQEIEGENLNIFDALQKVERCISCGATSNLELVSLHEGPLPSLEDWKKEKIDEGFLLWDSLDGIQLAGIELSPKSNDSFDANINGKYIFVDWTVGPDNKYYYYCHKDDYEALKPS